MITNLDLGSIILGSNILVYRAKKSMKTHFQELLALLFQQLSYHHGPCSAPKVNLINYYISSIIKAYFLYFFYLTKLIIFIISI